MNTDRSPTCSAKQLPLIGPKQNDSPNVANANPYAGALFFLSTQSEMYANVKGNVAEKIPDIDVSIANMYMFDVNANAHTGNVVPTTVNSKQYFLPT